MVDPDCTPEMAAKSAAATTTVGVGGGSSPDEAAKDSGKKAVGVEDKGPIEKGKNKNDKLARASEKSGELRVSLSARPLELPSIKIRSV